MALCASEVMESVVAALNKLPLNLVPSEWVDQVLDGQFTEAVELPVEFEVAVEGMDISQVLCEARRACAHWLKLHQKGEDEVESNNATANTTASFYRKGFWTVLTQEHGVKHPLLLALLFYYIERGSRQADFRLESVAAASLYFTFLGMPGSGAFKIFHPLLFTKALDVFKVVALFKAARASPSRQKGRRQGASQSQSQSTMREEEEGLEELAPEEEERLMSGFADAVTSLQLTLANCSLKRSPESLETVANALVSLTALETTLALDLRNNRRERAGSVALLATEGYRGLVLLCSSMHGERLAGSRAVLRSLLPGILMAEKEQRADLTPKERAVIREHGINFVLHLVESATEETERKEREEAAVLLVQHMAAKVPDKADWRREAASGILTLMEVLSPALLHTTTRWILKFAHSEKPSNRLFSLEVLSKLMYSDRLDSVAQPSETERFPCVPRSAIFACVFQRCSDISPSVRAAALRCLADITADQRGGVEGVVQQILSQEVPGRGDEAKGLAELLDEVTTDLSAMNLLPSRHQLVLFIRRRALDQSVAVRRSALQVLENILRSSPTLLVGAMTKVLADHCRDSSLAVRKQMVGSLTELVKCYPDNQALVSTWVTGVFPLILDAESKASEKVLECIWDCLFGNMVECGRAVTPHHALPWIILAAVEKGAMTNYLDRACATWAKEGKLGPVVRLLQSYIGTEHNGATWMVLGITSAHLPCKDVRQVFDYFNTSIATPEEVGLFTLHQVLKVLLASVANLALAQRSELQQLLLGLVSRFSIPTDLISVAFDVITVVSSLEAGEGRLQQYQSSLDGWAAPILKTIDTNLSHVFLTRNASTEEDEELLRRQIFSLGVLCMLCPHRVHSRFFLTMQSIVFCSSSTSSINQPSSEEPCLPSSQMPPSSQPPACTFQPGQHLQAVTIATLGKMCLQNEQQAKKIIPGFGQVLESTTDPAMKNNIMYCLADMCVRYASLVDPLLPQMTSCLKDPSVGVRRTTVILLVHLLQEDYLKVRGNARFLFRLLQTLLDPSEEIRHLMKFYLEQRLLKKIPNIIYSNFPESLFHFSGYTGHPTYNKTATTDQEKELFNLSGEKNEKEREKLYLFMLDSMSDEHRFQTTYRLCQDVLGGVVEGTLPLNAASLPLLRDTFNCLSSDQIKLQSLKTRVGGEEEAETEQEMAGKVLEAAKKKLISDTVKKNVMENIVPIIIALKHKLAAAKSPLLQDLFKYLRKLMDDYKNEVQDILAADRQLAAEVEFDLRRFEQEQREREEEEAAKFIRAAASPSVERRRSMAATPSLVSSGGSKESVVSQGSAGSGSAAPLATPKSSSNQAPRSLRKKILTDVLKRSSLSSTPSGSPSSTPSRRVPVSNTSLKAPTPGGSTAESEEVEVMEVSTKLLGNDIELGEDDSRPQEKSGNEKVDAESVTSGGLLSNGEGDTGARGGEVLEEEMPADKEDKDLEEEDGEEDRDINKEDKEVRDIEEEGEEEGMNKSKRVSGQGMERQKENRTPRSKTKRFHNVRAVSTPQANKTVLASNVTLAINESLELSSITVLSPPSTVAGEVTKRPSRSSAGSKKDDTDAVSFRFRRGSKDMFEELVDDNKEATKDRKRKKTLGGEEEESGKSSRSRSSGSSKVRATGSDLLPISEGRESQEED